MNEQTPQRQIPKFKEERVLRQIRKLIITGRYAPGSRLPTRSELEEQYEVSRQTMQNVFDALLNEGFVEARGRHGTFVTEHPPHLSNYGLVFTRHPSDEGGWPNFWTAFYNEAQALHRDGRRHFHAFYGGAFDATGSGSYQDLLDLVTAGRLAGLIFPARPHHLTGTPILEQPGMPRIVFTGPDIVPGALQIGLEYPRCFEKGLDNLLANGRSRIAFVVGQNSPETLWPHLMEMCQERGLQTRFDWYLGGDPLRPAWTARAAALLARLPADQRPDGLIIGDDNFVGDVVAGLTRGKQGLEIGRDIDVVGHANFPWVTPSPVPITRVGFDISQIVRTCVESIDRQRRGEHPPARTRIDPLFEDELT